MEVTILGRGESLKKLDKFESDCTDVILINEWWQSPRNPWNITKYLKFLSSLLEKILHLFVHLALRFVISD